uniref:Si:ch211-242b18.1 n=1 Tax=Oreochromis niloticus TaxID=8128 RepID=I3JV54_ORENI
MSNGYRTLSQHLNDLKKENFSLKLRIYFLEERIQQKYEESSEDVYRTNIELKVEVESLKQELQEKQDLLDKALTTAESLTNHNEAELQRRCQERQQEIDHMQQVLEAKIQLLQEEAQLARSEAERMASLAGSQSHASLLSLDAAMEEIPEDERPPNILSPSNNKDRLIEELTKELRTKEVCITELCGEKTTLTLRVEELEGQVQELSNSLLQKDKDVEKLQEKLSEMECELRSLRQASQSQERTIQGLTESLSTKDNEAQELYQLIEGQNTTLCKLQEIAHRSQLAQTGVSESLALAQLQGELVGVQSSLFSLGLELEASQRSLRQSQRQADDLMRFKERLNSDLQEALQHREVTEKHNQDLRCALHKLRTELQAKEAALKESEAEKHALTQEKDRSVAQLKSTLQDKEQQLQVTLRMLFHHCLQQSIDDKFRCVEEREGQVRRLQLALREKERDLERLRCILSNNEETITSLDGLVRGKELELEQAAEAYRNLQWLKQQSDEKERNSLREKDTIITQLQAALQTRSQETQDLTAALIARVQAGPTEVVEELKARLALKEKLFQELLADRSRQSKEHQAQIQDLLSTLSSKDQYLQVGDIVTSKCSWQIIGLSCTKRRFEKIKCNLIFLSQDYSYRLSLVISERTGQLQELHALLLQETAVAGDSSQVRALWRDKEDGLREQASRLHADLTLSQQENRELQERLMVSEATVQAQAEQLKEYRDLLTETSVQQANKQVQVDLQDLGYETCGRSENEAEREDTSSPEFDDLEMCTSLSHPQDCEVGGWYAGSCSSNRGAYEMRDESASLQHLVQDLRSQLTRCHKVIRGLQLRVRSLSATSDYASSLERTPRKVNWALERSPAPSGVDEDEGWLSDTQGARPGSKPSRELQELMERVASLEAQLKTTRSEGKGQAEEGKCATWPGKYNSLIQAQARELSHLRQRMREGQGVCHILTQHLGDTTKAFEELLRANDIDYYMGQSFREQLAQISPLHLFSFLSTGERFHCDIMMLLCTCRLSKELQQKDKIIESLHTKLQHRPETPSSCHALSETTDQSDRTSLVSDEYQTNEDLELCSDLDTREYQEEHRLRQPGLGSDPEVRSSIPPPLPPPPLHGLLKSSSSCPNMLCTAAVGLTRGRGITDGCGLQKSFSFFLLILSSSVCVTSCHSPPALFSEPVSSSFSIPSGPDGWGHEVMFDPRPRALSVMAVRPELDTLYKQMNEQNRGVNLIEEHLQEVRCLRQRLEESIRTNERLRQQLEEKLATTGRDGGAPTNIYIQGLDTVTQLSNEIRVLKEENLGLQSLSPVLSDTSEEVVQLREAVFTARARLKQSELEAEQWKEELRRLQAHSQEQGQQIHTLRQERQVGQEKTNRLQHEVSLLQQQLCESRELIHSLQSELHVYDRVCSSTKANKGYLCEVPVLPVELGELLGEVRSLRAQLQNSVQENSALKQLELHKQLEQKLGVGSPRTPSLSALTASPQRENFYRRQLLHDPAPSPPVRDIGLFNCGSPGPPYSDLDDSHSTANALLSPADPLDPHSELEGDAPDGSFANRNGRHAIGHVDDFSALQQQVLEGRSLVQRMEMTLQILDYGCVRSLLSNTKTLRQILEEAMSLLKMFWRAALPSTDPSIQNLKKLAFNSIKQLMSTSRTKESMEHFIVSQLSRTRDVLKKARTNLEVSHVRSLGYITTYS